MPKIVRDGDLGTSGGKVQVIQQSFSDSTGKMIATKGDLYFCINKRHRPYSPIPARLLNGCRMSTIQGRPMAIVNVTKASCGCRMKTGSEVSGCCNHLNDKAQRLADREALIDQARDKAADPNTDSNVAYNLKRNADDLARMNTDIRYAEASQLAYSPGTSGQGLLNLSNPNNMPEALKDIVFTDPKGGFSSDLYYDELNNNYILAFRGSLDPANILTDLASRDDWETNALQQFGITTSQFNQAMKVTDQVNTVAQANDWNLIIAGHSKGGGQASAAGTYVQIPFVTFNSSALNPNTVPAYSGGYISWPLINQAMSPMINLPQSIYKGGMQNTNGASLGTRYQTDKDILSYGMNLLGTPALGNKLYILPTMTQDIDGNIVPLSGSGPSIEAHNISNMIASIESRKKQLVAGLKLPLGLPDPYQLSAQHGTTGTWEDPNTGSW
jgi:uncharacterized Zn-binding protein involved in type VI secretion